MAFGTAPLKMIPASTQNWKPRRMPSPKSTGKCLQLGHYHWISLLLCWFVIWGEFWPFFFNVWVGSLVISVWPYFLAEDGDIIQSPRRWGYAVCFYELIGHVSFHSRKERKCTHAIFAQSICNNNLSRLQMFSAFCWFFFVFWWVFRSQFVSSPHDSTRTHDAKTVSTLKAKWTQKRAAFDNVLQSRQVVDSVDILLLVERLQLMVI